MNEEIVVVRRQPMKAAIKKKVDFATRNGLCVRHYVESGVKVQAMANSNQGVCVTCRNNYLKRIPRDKGGKIDQVRAAGFREKEVEKGWLLEGNPGGAGVPRKQVHIEASK